VLAEDIGAALGCGAHVTGLSRTGSGGFALADAVTLDDLEQRAETARDAALLPVDALVAGLARLDLEDNDAIRLEQGQAIVRAELVDGIVRVYTARGFAGVASVVGGIVRPRRLRAQMSSRPSAATDNLLES